MNFKNILSYFKWTVKWVIVLAVVTVVTYLAYHFKVYTDIAIALSTSSILVLLTYDLLNLMTRITYIMENKRLSKQYKLQRKVTLFRWSEGNDVPERFFYGILKVDISEDPVKNMDSIKKRIKDTCSGDLSKLKLLKAYVERSMSNNIIDRFWSIFFGVLIATITSIFNDLSTEDKFINFIHSYITGSTTNIFNITNVISYLTYFLIFLIFFGYTWSIFTRDRRRLNLLIKIIDVAISEIELKINKTQ